jgi:hypothetical protein
MNRIEMLKRAAGFTAIGAMTCALTCDAGNPVVQTKFTADPAPLVHDGTVYLYTSHDEDDAPAGQGRFLMRDWLLYTSTDMVNWTDHGVAASLKTFPWAVQENDAWAPQVVARNGKFYLYAPVSVKGWPKNVIAVAVSDSPFGPFKDVLGKPLINKENGFIDPTVLIDDDGQAYLYWGNPNLWYVKLNEDMISTSGEIVKDASFAKVKGQPDPYHYQEGPWAFKKNGLYYMAYASTCCPEGIGYAMSDKPVGPWTFKGYIVKPDRRSTGNHPGIIDYKGKSYVFGFNFKLNFAITKKHHERRSVCVAEMEFNPDGTIQELPWWEEAVSVKQIGTLNPFVRTEAETICWSEGMKSEPGSQEGMCVRPVGTNAHILVKGVDFGKGAKSFTASVASAASGEKIEIRLDSPAGPLVGTCRVPDTGGAQKMETISCPVKDAVGVHDLCFVFPGAEGIRFDWWKFE